MTQRGDRGHGRDLEPDREFGSGVVHSTCFCAGFIWVGDVNTHPGVFLNEFISVDLI